MIYTHALTKSMEKSLWETNGHLIAQELYYFSQAWKYITMFSSPQTSVEPDETNPYPKTLYLI
jgi:hypothetical protein